MLVVRVLNLFICMYHQDSLVQQCQAVGSQKAASENRMVS